MLRFAECVSGCESNVCLFCRSVGLLSGNIGILYGNVGPFCRNIVNQVQNALGCAHLEVDDWLTEWESDELRDISGIRHVALMQQSWHTHG